jgi:hypothetical protein
MANLKIPAEIGLPDTPDSSVFSPDSTKVSQRHPFQKDTFGETLVCSASTNWHDEQTEHESSENYPGSALL